MRGHISHEIGRLSNSLDFLDLGDNLLTGSLPEQISSLTSLRVLSLYGNQLNSTVPKSIFRNQLKALYLDGNYFTGTIPTSVGVPKNSLTDLRLRDNLFTGQIPDEVTNLSEFFQTSKSL